MSDTHNLNAEGRALIHAILEIALTTRREVADVFVNWSPHCELIAVEIHAGGWREGVRAGYSEGLYIDHCENAIEALKWFKGKAEKYLAETCHVEEAEMRARKAIELRAAAARLISEAQELEVSK